MRLQVTLRSSSTSSYCILILFLLSLNSLQCFAINLKARASILPKIDENGIPNPPAVSPIAAPDVRKLPIDLSLPICLYPYRFPFRWPDEGLPGPNGVRFHKKDYNNLEELCLKVIAGSPYAIENLKPNFDCRCDEYGEVTCHNSVWAPGVVYYCKEGCDCPKPKRHRPEWLKQVQNLVRARRRKDQTESAQAKTTGEVEMKTIAAANGPPNTDQSEASSSQTCSGSCMGYLGCASQRNTEGCEDTICVAKKSNKPTKSYLSGGCVSISKFLGKRNIEPFDCLCNQTYASTSCCDAESGIVHEDLRLGDLRL